ncbi:hypothetical protein N780_15645 [Pontibacillus chungwhensis BH030062]|uniref:DoxX-like family protein n=1 Tax=Pontibacillus chungwhensis BH030062 TaxID=1385513 RepID=A0A0A2UU51_9BACI|nr:DoxX-like family protein [Pontibacillus chungwhensis]KGP91807.1 hypothetical protein N780_15645 [Pontibacillus chungwhensis BH030062]
MKKNSIYVEIPIHAEMEDLWEASQNPGLHEQWDLRFSSISYQPKEREDDPQEFTYRTNIGLGLSVEGWGRSKGTHDGKDGSRTSSLHFGTDQKISIITEGKGYWKYIPKADKDMTFLTQYDYQTRFGTLGAWVDRLFFRPMIGWATALSFDVLKRWLEKGMTPKSQYLQFFAYWILSFFFSFIWIYHGLIPKVLYKHPEEIALAESLLPLSVSANSVVFWMGIAEILFGLSWWVIKRRRRLYYLQVFAFPILTASAIMADPSTLTHPFSPLTYNSSLFLLSVLGLAVSRDVPTAKNCKRQKKESA